MLVDHYNVYLDQDDLFKLIDYLGYYRPKKSRVFWDGETNERFWNRIIMNLQDQEGKWHNPAEYDRYKGVDNTVE